MHGVIFSFATDLDEILDGDVCIPDYEDVKSYLEGVDYSYAMTKEETKGEYEHLADAYGIKNFKIYTVRDQDYEERLIMEIPKREIVNALTKVVERNLNVAKQIIEDKTIPLYERAYRVKRTIEPYAGIYFASGCANVMTNYDFLETLVEYEKDSSKIYLFAATDYHV